MYDQHLHVSQVHGGTGYLYPHSPAWWKNIWGKAGGIEIIDVDEMNCCKQAWDEWLTSPNPYAKEDMKMMEAENGQYFNFIEMIARII